MNYKINKTNYRNFNKFSENRLEHRSYFIPFHSENAMNACDFFTERKDSDAVTLLSGEWDFAYYKYAYQLHKEIDTDKMQFDKINVPSTWQKTGYDRVNYLNSMYPFYCSPPRTPKNCPVGVYRKKFKVNKKTDFNYIITFLGVISSLDLYLNGEYVGYSEGAHNSHEFDITALLNNGENELLCVVYKWSTGTYLECQDMFRENGIFRDVYINEMPQNYIFDFEFKTEKKNDFYNTALTADIRGNDNVQLKADLMLGDNCIAQSIVNKDEELRWNNLNVEEWNSEIPVCYDLILTLISNNKPIQFIRHKVGFCTIELDGCRYLFNGKLIKLKGVNHHDTHPIRGYAMTAEDLKKDVELMKEYNVNCIRTSHYPPDPMLMTLCDVYGLYVVDEADIETHGCYVRNIDLISNDPKWKNHYLDRMQALFERDKNHICVVMWSMGNEAGGISNFDACYEYLKTKTNIPVHYEPACRSKRIRYDILAHFYTSPADMRALRNGEWEDPRNYDAPFFLCEYAHSMGVGPGALDEYWDVIYSDDRFLGGCIWEWADHSHYDEKAKYKWTYGGDHGDLRHSGNFCCDGLFYPDRKPSTSALCMKNVYSPLRASLHCGMLTIENTNRFASSKDIKITYYILKNEKIENKKEIDIAIEPQSSVQLPMDFVYSENDDAFLILEYTDIKSGKNIAREQIVLNEAFESSEVSRQTLNWHTDNSQMSLSSDKNKITWDKNGRLIELRDKNGDLILDNDGAGFVPMLYQAVIDNHIYASKSLKKAGLDKLNIKKQRANHDAYKNTVTSTFFLNHGASKRFKAELIQKAVSAKEIYVTLNLTSLYKNPLDMLQIGLNLNLNSSYNNVRYYGMGDAESYSDFASQDVMGIYDTNASSMYEDNIKPQESGNRTAVRWAEITNNQGSGIRITALDKSLDFKAVDIEESNLRKAKHMEDVVRQSKTILHINGFMRGIGSQSCGPDTDDKYKKVLHYKESYSYSFKIEII